MTTIAKRSKVVLDSTDISADVRSWEITDKRDNLAAEFKGVFIRNLSTTLGSAPEEGNVIQVYRGTSATPEESYLFKGRIYKTEYDGITYTIYAYDMLHDLVTAEATHSYDQNIDASAGKISEIFKDLVNTYSDLTADSTSVTDSGSTILIEKFTADHEDVFAKCEELAKILDWHFYYDPTTDLVYFEPQGTSASGVTLYFATSAGTTNIMKKPVWKYDRTMLANHITVFGATKEVETTETFSGDASTKAFTLSFVPQSVKAFIGGVLKAGGVDDSSTGHDYTIDTNLQTPKINFASAPASGTNNIEVRYSYIIRAPVLVKDEASKTKFGKWYKKTINEGVFDTVEDASKFAQEYLSNFSNQLIIATQVQVSQEQIVKAGKSVQVIDGSVGENRAMIVKEVKMVYPSQSDTLTIGDKEWRMDKWMLDVQKNIEKLLKKEKHATNLLLQIVQFSTDFGAGRYTLNQISKKVNDSFILGHEYNSKLNMGTVLDTMEAVGNWVASDGTLSASATQSKQGTNSLKNTGYSSDFTLTDSITSLGDLSAYTGQSSGAPTQGTVGCWLYLTNSTDATALSLKLGSSASDYTNVSGVTYASSRDYHDEDATFSAGWNYVLFHLPDGTETGTPDWTAVDYAVPLLTNGATQGDVFFDYFTISSSNFISENGLGDRTSSEVTDYTVTY